MDRFGFRLEYSLRKLLRYLAQESEVYNFKFALFPEMNFNTWMRKFYGSTRNRYINIRKHFRRQLWSGWVWFVIRTCRVRCELAHEYKEMGGASLLHWAGRNILSIFSVGWSTCLSPPNNFSTKHFLDYWWNTTCSAFHTQGIFLLT
jgi:hypothetical protein